MGIRLKTCQQVHVMQLIECFLVSCHILLVNIENALMDNRHGTSCRNSTSIEGIIQRVFALIQYIGA